MQAPTRLGIHQRCPPQTLRSLPPIRVAADASNALEPVHDLRVARAESWLREDQGRAEALAAFHD